MLPVRKNWDDGHKRISGVAPVRKRGTIIKEEISACSKNLLSEVTSALHDLGEISGKTIFIDGTKIESCANKYTFVWKKSVKKHQARLFERILSFIAECEALYGLRIVYNGKATLHTLKRLRKKLYRRNDGEAYR